MRIKFITSPPGRPDYKIGDEVDFNGRVEEGYARKYIERGWAELIDSDVRVTGLEADMQEKTGPRPIEVRQDMVGETAIQYLVGPWPKLTAFADELLANPDMSKGAVKVDGDKLELTFANATATYKRAEKQEIFGVVAFDLVEGVFEPAPEPQKQDQAGAV